MAGDGGAEERKGTAFVAPKEEQKGKLSIDPMVEGVPWMSTYFSAPAEESISLVGKSTGMPSATLRGFAPESVGIGQMKLEAQPQ